MPTNLEDLGEEELDTILKSKMVQKYLAYRDLAAGIDALEEDDVMYQQLLQGINDRFSRVSKNTIDKVLKAFKKEVETNTEALETVEEQ